MEWFVLENAGDVESPALLVYPDRLEENIRRMLAQTGDPKKLRPHAKTHKMSEVALRQIAAGIKKFKVATIAEAEMLARAGAEKVLLAYQPVGPNVRRILELKNLFPRTEFACLVDDLEAARNLAEQAYRRGTKVDVFLDVDCGQHRTGVPPDSDAFALYQQLACLEGLNPIGLHAYDGHIHDNDPAAREQACEAAFAPVAALQRNLQALGLSAETLVAGGTPTFPFHAKRPNVECSPGTCVFWDFSYSSRYPDLDFLHAALVLTRVVSKPGGRRLCLDLGHKAIASENPPPRVHFLNLPAAQAVGHSEEHLVIEIDNPTNYKVGDCLYGVPWHVCPTVALHAKAVVVEHGRAVHEWRVEARDRHLEI